MWGKSRGTPPDHKGKQPFACYSGFTPGIEYKNTNLSERYINFFWNYWKKKANLSLTFCLQSSHIGFHSCSISWGQHGSHPGLLSHNVHPLPSAKNFCHHVSIFYRVVLVKLLAYLLINNGTSGFTSNTLLIRIIELN